MDFIHLTYILPDFKIFVGDPPHLVHYTREYLSDFQNFDGHPPHLVHYTPVYLPKFQNEKTPPPRLWVSTLPYDPPCPTLPQIRAAGDGSVLALNLILYVSMFSGNYLIVYCYQLFIIHIIIIINTAVHMFNLLAFEISYCVSMPTEPGRACLMNSLYYYIALCTQILAGDFHR